MQDHKLVLGDPDKIHLIIGEVKTGLCNLNGPWTNPERENMLRALKAIGIFRPSEADAAKEALYQVGYFTDPNCRVSLICFGGEKNFILAEKYPKIPQILWSDVLPFIYNRFKSYRKEKVSHPQWDARGKSLWSAFEDSRNEETFIKKFNF